MFNPMRRSRWIMLSLFCAMAVILTACGEGEGVNQVKVALSFPLDLTVGEDMLHAAELALEEANYQAGDVTVEPLIANTSDPEGSPVSTDMEKAAAEAASQDPDVVGYLGGATSDQAGAAMQVLNEAGIVQLSASATWPGLTKPGFKPGEPGIYYPTGRRHFFRVATSDDVQGVFAAQWAAELGAENSYIIDDEGAYGQGIAGIFEVSVSDYEIEVIGRDSFPGADTSEADLTALSEEIIATQPDLLYIGTSLATGGQAFLSVFQELNQASEAEIMVMVPDGMVQEQLFAELGAELTDGIYATNIIVPVDEIDTQAARNFMASYQEAYGKVPPPYAVNTYEAMGVLLYAIEQAETPTRVGVLNAMPNLSHYSGVFGQWSFNSLGDISQNRISCLQAQEGEWVFIKVLE